MSNLRQQTPKEGHVLKLGEVENILYASGTVYLGINAEEWEEIPVTDPAYQEWLKANNTEE